MQPLISYRAFLYILYALFWPFILSFFSFFGLIFIFQFIRNSELLLLDLNDIHMCLKVFIFDSLSHLPLIIPFCLLFGILFGFGKLSSNHELTAFSNLGYSKPQLSIPAVFMTLICFFICSSSIHTWGPNAKSKSKFINSILTKKLALSTLQPGIFLNNLPNTVFYTETINNSTKDLTRVFLLTDGNQKHPKFIFSNSGAFLKPSSPEESFRLLLNDGQLFNQDKKRRNFIVDFESYKISLFKNKVFNFINTKPKYLTSKRLSEFKKIKYRIEYHKRIVLSLACFIFLFLSLLFSLKLHSRSSSGRGFLLALFFSLAFWIILFISEYISISQNIIMTIYLPTIIFLIVIVFVYYWNKSRLII